MSNKEEEDEKPSDFYEGVEELQRVWRRTDREFLETHPELRATLRVFLHEAINKRPENFFIFAAELFDPKNMRDLKEKVNEQLVRVKETLRKQQDSAVADFYVSKSVPLDNEAEAAVEQASKILHFAMVAPPTEHRKSVLK